MYGLSPPIRALEGMGYFKKVSRPAPSVQSKNVAATVKQLVVQQVAASQEVQAAAQAASQAVQAAQTARVMQAEPVYAPVSAPPPRQIPLPAPVAHSTFSPPQTLVDEDQAAARSTPAADLPKWVIPAALGGVALIVLMSMGKK